MSPQPILVVLADPTLNSVNLSTPEAAAAFYFKAVQGGALTIQVSNGTPSGSAEQTQ